MLSGYKTISNFLDSLRDDIRAKTPVDSGKLKNSIKTVVLSPTEGSVEMLEYGLYLDKGVNGIKKSYGSIYSYSSKKPPISSLNRNSTINPYGLQQHIFNNGIAPRKFINQSNIDNKTDKFAIDIAEEIGNNILNQL